MKKTKVKIPAKLNLTLDIKGVKNGYHVIRSLVTSIDLYDEITVSARKDNLITLKETGVSSGCNLTDNTAYKAARLFAETYSSNGVDIAVKKNIPVGGGLGGSSADIAGVLIGMSALYGADFNIIALANHLGSDSGYMLEGGFAVISDRGNVVSPLRIDRTLYMLLITHEKPITARECYKTFDSEGKNYEECTDRAVERLVAGDVAGMCKVCKNHLFHAAESIVPEIQSSVYALKVERALLSTITGSGSAVFGVFADKKQRDTAYKTLLPRYGKRLIKIESVNE